MNIRFTVGAPSLTGKGAQEEVEAIISSMEFPCSLHVVNNMPRAAVFPESGVELASSIAGDGHVAEVTFASAAALKRLLRTASEVAELNGYALALTVTDEALRPITDEELTEQFVEANPELKEEVDAAGGVDAAATLADAADTTEAGDKPAEVVELANEDGANADSDINTNTEGTGAGGDTTEAGDKPAEVVELAKPQKADGKKHKAK